MAILILAVLTASVLTYVALKIQPPQKEFPQLSDRVPPEAMNVLVLGSDSREGLSEEELQKYDPEGIDRKTGRRADTIILLHVDANRDKVILVHFPRDLRVELPNGKMGKINGAYQGGTGSMIDAVEKFSGVPVHHVVEVNFAGFNNIVDALGGIEMYFEKPIDEADSGLNVPQGCVELKGDQALAFVRIRKIDDDFGRIKRQQLFMKLMMEKVTSAGTLLNVPRIVKLVNLVSENVITDTKLDIRDVYALAIRLRDLSPDKIDMRVVPSTGRSIRGVSYVIATESQTKALFSAIRDGQPLPDYGRTGVSPVDPAEVRVTVMNGTTTTGLAAKTSDELKQKGFQVVATTDADKKPYPKTVVYYVEGNDIKAREVAGLYGVDVKPVTQQISRLVFNSDVVLVIGEDAAASGGAPPPPPASPAGKPQQEKPLIHPCDE